MKQRYVWNSQDGEIIDNDSPRTNKVICNLIGWGAHSSEIQEMVDTANLYDLSNTKQQYAQGTPMGMNEFELINVCDLYADYERWVSGFGVTNDDRLERITLIKSDGKFYASVRHVDTDGNEWYCWTSDKVQSWDQCVELLKANSQIAPRTKS